MRKSRVKRRWAEGKPVLATVSHFHDPHSAELIGLMGIDCLWIEFGHVRTLSYSFGSWSYKQDLVIIDSVLTFVRPSRIEQLRKPCFPTYSTCANM